MPPPRRPRPAPPRSTGASLTEIRDFLGLILGNAAVLTSVLVYFGWRRNDSHAAALGLRESLTEQSTSDYVLKSVSSVINIALLTLIAAYLGLLGLRLLRRARTNRDPRTFRRITTGLMVMGALLPVAVATAGFAAGEPDVGTVGFPLAIGVAALIAWFAWRERQPRSSRSSLGSRLLISAVVVVTSFWTVDRYAEHEGRTLGEHLGEEIPTRTEVVVFSPDRLYIDAPGSHETKLDTADGKYRYRYGGLRLLDRTGDRYFLISDCWTPQYGVVLILPVQGDLRYEFVRDTRSTPRCPPAAS